MSIEKDRLCSLIEFSQQSVRLRSKPVASVSSYGLPALYEHEIQGLPGIRINSDDLDNEGEIWLVIERLHEIKPPAISNVVLSPWVKMTDVPTEEPSLRETISTTLFAESKNDYSSEMVPGEVNSNTIPKGEISLSDFKDAEQIRSHFATYLITKWQPWAEIESRRRKTIWIYNQLFKIKQQLEGSIVEAQLELVWGLGMGIWNNNGVHVKYPLIGQLVEISLNPVTAELEIRPRDFDANIEIEWYASVKNPGVFSLEKMAKKFFEKTELTFSPFEKGTFEPLLRTAATTLDANGIYWPNEVPAEDRTLPKEDEKLKVTDTWILFARPRNNNLFLHDLEKLKSQIEEVETFPPTVAALVTEPNSNNPVVELPLFRGICTLPSAGEGACYKKAQDLYFPKPFNDEQVRIIQLLAINDGVVVQGPPGTGKTHTIANVICHYLAQGKRVLVTSMKDPALKVLHEQLPAEIRPLAISILTSEQEGMKQFEHAIHKIASEVQGFDRSGTERTIKQLEENIDSLHGKLASIDYTIGEWVKNNIKKIMLEGEEIDPQDASHEVVQNIGQFEWISDPLGIAVEFDPQFSDSDVVSLREARRVLGKDIDYISASLPQLVEFPDAVELVAIHQDQKQLTKLQQCIDNGEVPEIADSSQETLAHANSLLMMIGEVKSLRDAVIHSNYKWPNALREQLRWNNNRNLFESLEELGGELEQVEKTRNKFLECPVVVPPGIEFDEEIEEAINKLSLGKSPFGIKGLFGKSEKKKCLESILVLGDHPNSEKSWKYVLEYLDVRKRLRQLALRWNALAKEIKIDTVSEDKPEGGIAASQAYNIYIKVKQIVIKELEICSGTESIFPNWAYSYDVADNEARMNELEKVLRHYLAKNRLASVWINKERFQKVLDNCNGRVVEDIRQFLSETLGNPAIEDAKVKAEWSGLMAELSRVHSISKSLAVVQEVCNKVEASGAPNYATLLKQPFEGSVDFLLPDNLRKIWRIKRMSSYLHSIDAQDKLRILAKERRQIENGLSHAYLDIVVKRTWLRLAENASASMRSALQAYLNAIQKIGKGTGKRAVRYRQDARIAATKANPIVPCWIMPHYRVSESLTSELGCFDLVVVDEASQSDLTALPALLRAKKVLIVGDDKQVSPDGVGLEEDSIRNLMSRFLSNQVEIYGRQMSPERSIYDLYKVVFAGSTVMLKEHFRCVSPIIEYSKREFYNHELRPLRIPKTSERLDPPLVDVMIESGYRENDINRAEARFIVNEIKEIISDEKMGNRTIGVVSLLGYKQASTINEILIAEIGTEAMQCHQIECGDARTFQGKERSIMFLSMVSAPNNVGAPLSRDTFAQRFNVAASRARDRMYLVRSVEARCLSEADMLRRNLIAHFTAPYIQDEAHVESRRNLCE